MRISQARSRSFRLVVGGLVAVGLLYWIGRNANSADVVRAIQTMSPRALGLTLLILYASIPVRVLQWRILLGNIETLPLAPVARSLCLGYLGNSLAPMGGGEVVKTYALSRSTGISFANALASTVIIRVQDLPPVGVLALLAFALLPGAGALRHPSRLSDLYVTFLVFAILSLLVVVAIVIFPKSRKYWGHAVTSCGNRIAPKMANSIGEKLQEFGHGLLILRGRRSFLCGQFLAAICWALFALAPIPLLSDLGLNFAQALRCALTLTGITTLFQLVPITPSGFGTYHLACVWVLTLINPAMPQSTALAYALVSHALGTFGPALPGVLLLPWTFSDLAPITNSRRDN